MSFARYSMYSLLRTALYAAIILAAIDVLDRCWMRHKQPGLAMLQAQFQIADLHDEMADARARVAELEKQALDDTLYIQQLQVQVGDLLLTKQEQVRE